MKAMILGAENPIAAPKIARTRWLRAFADPATNESPATTSPRIEARGRITVMSFI